MKATLSKYKAKHDGKSLLPTLRNPRGGDKLVSTTGTSSSLSANSKCKTGRSRAKLMTVNPSMMFIPPTFKKSRDEEKFIDDVLHCCFLFVEGFATAENTTDLSEVVSAFEEVYFAEDSYILKQGETCGEEYLYIVYCGECSVFIDGKKLPMPYGTLREGSLIGDLAIIYDTPKRAATIQAVTPVKAFRLDRQSCNYFLFLEVIGDGENSRKSFVSSLLPPKRDREKLQIELKEIDSIIDQASGLKQKYGGNIIKPFQPSRKWLWSQWQGTILHQAWKVACWNMLMCLVFVLLLRLISQPMSWSIMMIPEKDHSVIAHTLGLSKLW